MFVDWFECNSELDLLFKQSTCIILLYFVVKL